MAITGNLTIIDTDFSNSINSIVSACSPNVFRINATLNGGADSNAYVEIYLYTFYFRMINKTFNGTTGEFYFDFTDILPYLFTDVSDDILNSGVQNVIDSFLPNTAFDVTLKKSDGTDLDVMSIEIQLLFSSKQIGNPNGSNEVEIADGQMPNFLAQKNKQSYIYYFGSGTCVFEKVGHIPEQYAMIDNSEALMIDNNGDAMINEY